MVQRLTSKGAGALLGEKCHPSPTFSVQGWHFAGKRAPAPSGLPTVIGVTGTVGCGKSTVAKLFEACGALRLDADAVVHRLYRHERALRRALRRAFGPGVIGSRARVDREALAARVFKSARDRHKLERLVHPLVRREFARAIRASRRRVVVMEVPLLFESGFDRGCDATVMVIAPAKIAARRLGARARDMARRNRAQWPAARKARRADHVIRNAGSRRALRLKVKRIYQLMTPAGSGRPASKKENRR